MERITTSIISLLLALSFVNAKANDVPRQNENIIANYSLDEDDTLRYSNHYLFEQAYNVIGDMLTDKRPVDFKKAVFAVENAFYDGKLDSASYYGEIARIGKGIKALAASPAVNAPTRDMALNYSIYLFYTQPMALNKGEPYYYDEQSLHDSLNLEYGLISRLLTTGKGTCHSMPFLYRILADEVGAKAYIVSVPLHYFIRTQNEKGNWFNFESTTGTFSRNEYYIESYHVNDSALQSGLYMSNLTDKGNLVQCLYDLLNIYEKKTGFFSNSFVRRCYTLGLKYRPNDNLRLWELEDIHYQLKKKAWHKGHKNNNDVMADEELRPERLRLREKELELLRIGYHRFTAAEYAERYHAALDYCRDRQSKVSHFLTVDPKADQYPGINPYLYCAGNPIMYVDPTGEWMTSSAIEFDCGIGLGVGISATFRAVYAIDNFGETQSLEYSFRNSTNQHLEEGSLDPSILVGIEFSLSGEITINKSGTYYSSHTPTTFGINTKPKFGFGLGFGISEDGFSFNVSMGLSACVGTRTPMKILHAISLSHKEALSNIGSWMVENIRQIKQNGKCYYTGNLSVVKQDGNIVQTDIKLFSDAKLIDGKWTNTNQWKSKAYINAENDK